MALGLTIYACMTYSTEIWDLFNDLELGLRNGTRLLRGGIQLAVRHMPQGPTIAIPLTESQGLQYVTHVIVHFEDAEPDLGHKGFQPEQVHLATRLAQSAVTALKRYQGQLLRKRTGSPGLIQNMRLQTWIDEQREHERSHPLRFTGFSGLFCPTAELPIRSEPLVEQDVVALFNQMLSAGLIRGIELLSSSQYKQYDGLFRYRMVPPFDTYIYSPSTNPLAWIIHEPYCL